MDRKIRKGALVLAMIFPAILFSQNYWHQTGFNFGGDVYALTISFENAVIAGKNDKVFRSINSGKTWAQIQTLPNDIQCFGRNPENGDLYAGLYYAGISKSIDGGGSWISAGLAGKKVNNIVIKPDMMIFAACSSPDVNGGGIYKSTDNGNNWTLVLNSLYDVYGLCQDDLGNIYAGTSDLTSNGWGLLLKSSDNGNTWTVVGNYPEWGGNIRGVAVDHAGVLFIGTSNGKIYRSFNNGSAWSMVLNGLDYYNTLPILINSENDIYIGSYGGGILESENSGNTWTSINSGITSLNIVSLCFTQDEYIYSGSRNSSIFLSNQTSSSILPMAPQLIFPLDNAGKISLTTLLDWNNVPHTITYSLQISKTNTFSTLVHSVPKVLVSNYIIPSGILDNTTQYFWRVNAKDSVNTSNWSAIRCFTTSGPALPKNLFVGSGSTAIDWPYFTIYTDSKCDIIYTASEINGSGGFAGDITKIGFNVLQRSNLYPTLNGLQIKMQHTSLSTLNGLITSGWTTVYAGTYTIPATGWQYISLSTPFTWNGTDNILLEICYDNPNGYGGTSSVVYGSVTQDLKVYHKYMDNGYGCDLTNAQGYTHNSVYRPGICFELIPANPPATPTLISPSNNSTGISLTSDLTWTGNPSAYKYHVQVSTIATFSSAVVDVFNLTNPIYTIPVSTLTNGTDYYWRVNSTNHNGTSLWTDCWKFTTLPPTIPANLPLENITLGYGSNNCYNATQIITVAGNSSTFIVQNGASATLIAGQKINYFPGAIVNSGGYMHGYIAPAGPYCGTQSAPMVATVSGHEKLPINVEPSFLSVYPNPTSGNFILEFHSEMTTDNLKIEIYDIRGEKVLSEAVPKEGSHSFSLSRNPLGVYFLRVINGLHAETIKIIKQ